MSSLNLLPDKLMALRKERRLTRAEAAEGMGVPLKTLQGLEQGRSGKQGPSLTAMMKLSDYYGVTTDWLLGRSDVRSVLAYGLVIVDREVLESLREASCREDLQKISVGGKLLWSFTVPREFAVIEIDGPEYRRISDELDRELNRLGVKRQKRHQGGVIEDGSQGR